jgi:hypothetical protein
MNGVFMLKKKNLGTLLLILGVGLFIVGAVVSHRVKEQEQRISQSEGGYRRPTLGPVRRHAQAEASENYQERKTQADLKIETSAMTANWLRGIGVVFFVVGLGSLLFRKKP